MRKAKGAPMNGAPSICFDEAQPCLRSGLHWAPHGLFWSLLGEPACDLDLVLGEEADAVLTRCVQVPVEGVLHAVEREERHRGGDADVDAEHSSLYFLAPVADGRAVLGVDRAGVAEGRGVGELYCLVEGPHAHHREDGAEDLLARHPHLSVYVIEYRRSEEEALLAGRLAPVEDDFSPLLLAQVDVASDLLAVGVADHGGEFRAFLVAGPDLHGLCRLLYGLDEPVSHLSDSHEDASCQAPLPCVAVGGGDDVGHSLLEGGIRHHDHGVLRPGQSLHPLLVRGAVYVDVLGYGLAPYERDRLYAGVLQDGVDRLPRPIDYREDPLG